MIFYTELRSLFFTTKYSCLEFIFINMDSEGVFFQKVKNLKTKIKEVLRWQGKIKNHLFQKKEMEILSPLREEKFLFGQER